MVAVAPEYLAAALDEMQRRFGGIDGYFAVGLKIDEATQNALRAVLVESV